jgi:hypothetical protein
MSRKVSELYGVSTLAGGVNWDEIVSRQHCPFLDRTCIKTRKSQPDISIGTCTVGYRTDQNMIICPHRFLEQGQIFMDCLHLLTLHEPGNQLHTIAEIEVPGGSVDYFLVSARNGKVIDFVGIELQSLDTTGTVWPTRQRFLGLPVDEDKSYGMNWKMTAKTTLVQLHHKVETFQGLGKHLVLVMQDMLMDYMRQAFRFEHIQTPRLGDALHFHAYSLDQHPERYQLRLDNRASTDADGMAEALGLQVSPDVEMAVLIATLESKLSDATRLHVPPRR